MSELDLHTVQGFVKGIRSLLQDKHEPFRYPDNTILAALNLALLEGLRLRPDLFLCRGKIVVPQYNAVSGDEIPIEPQFRLAFEYGGAAHVLLRDEEDVQDSRANTFNENFHDMLVGVRPHPVQGGTPSPAEKSGGNSQPKIGP